MHRYPRNARSSAQSRPSPSGFAHSSIDMPALTIVGAVVQLRRQLHWFESLPLFGKRVLVTRPEGQSESLAQALRDLGAEPIELPTIRVQPAADQGLLRAHIAKLEGYDWVIFTSVNGVKYFFEALYASGGDARRLGRVKLAAIGPATSQALIQHGLRADLVPDEYRGEALAEAIQRVSGQLSNVRILLPRAEVARDALPSMLSRAGAQVDVVPAYRTVAAPPQSFSKIRERLEQGTIDIVTFTSPSTVERLLEALGADAAALLARSQLVAIGPITSQAIEAHGFKVHTVASSYTSEGLVEALVAQRSESA